MTFARLLLVFLCFAFLEVMVMSAVAELVGWPITLLLLLATGIIGSFLLKREGTITWARLQQRLQAGEMPGKEVLEGVLLLIGSVCLITPGFITDSIGFLLLIPASRRKLANWAVERGKIHAFSQFSSVGSQGFKKGFYEQAGFKTGNVYEGHASVDPQAANEVDPRDSAASIHQLHKDD